MLIYTAPQGSPNRLIRQQILDRLEVNLETGTCLWKDATKHHARLNGTEAGTPIRNHCGKQYWVIKINGVGYKRSHIVVALKTGRWPDETVDHVNGNSLDDRAENLRHASVMQNAWNHKKRAKPSNLPMGVRQLQPSGRFQARIRHANKCRSLGVFETVDAAQAAYIAARHELFGEFA